MANQRVHQRRSRRKSIVSLESMSNRWKRDDEDDLTTESPSQILLVPTTMETSSSSTENETTATTRTRSKQEWQHLRKVAGGKNNLLELQTLIREQEWSMEELNTPLADGKGILHIAAWYGDYENVRWLLQIGCHVDILATGQYTYGKTPLFFAITKCRDDVCQLLLEHNAKVCIVNNKGQSVLSLASSHLSSSTIQAIQRAEIAENNWLNYRATHSDGLVYGDLDPRFLDRALTDEDNVTALAINPTTKELRRGNFARNNPQHPSSKSHPKKSKVKKANKSTLSPQPPTHHEWQQYEATWQQLREMLLECQNDSDQKLASQSTAKLGQLLLSVLHFWDRQRCSWLAATSQQLYDLVQDLQPPTQTWKSLLLHSIEEISMRTPTNQGSNSALVCGIREKQLLKKLVYQAFERNTSSETTTSRSRTEKYRPVPNVTWNEKLLKQAWNTVRLQLPTNPRALLQNPPRHPTHLSLPRPPVWVDSTHGLAALQHNLQVQVLDQASHSHCAALAIDTEWYSLAELNGKESKDDVAVATLQIAWIATAEDDENTTLQACVIDLLGDDSYYRAAAATFIDWLFHQSNSCLLGFAMGHDLPKLSRYVQGQTNHTTNSSAKSPSLPTHHCLDLQVVLSDPLLLTDKTGAHANKQTGNVPGLKACCRTYLSSPANHDKDSSSSWVLSKEEQCSDWTERPLAPSQLEYAGLDAGVLLVLLAELERIV